MKAVINGEKAKFYLNEENVPTLIVNKMFHGENISGGIGFFVDIGTEGFFKNLEYINRRYDETIKDFNRRIP